MHSFRSPCLIRRLALFVAALALATGSARAQFAHSPALLNSISASATESSSAADPTLIAEGSASPVREGSSSGQESGAYDTYGHSRLNHLTWEVGGGFNAPVSNSTADITWGFNFNLGGGYQFNRRLSALIEYQFIHDKLPGQLIGEVGATGGYANIWSFTAAPVVDLFPKSANDVYLTGGGGFYRKVTSFTDPVLAEFCNYYYCSIGYTNAVVGHFSSNQGGWNAGAGYQHRLGGIYGDSRMKLFAEARYLKVLTPAESRSPNGLGVATIHEDTTIIPVTLGVRW